MKVAVCNSVGIDADGYAMIHSPSRWTNSTKDHSIFTYYPWQLAYCSSILKRDTDHEVKFLMVVWKNGITTYSSKKFQNSALIIW